jgi:predicted secreted hydrolase
MNITSTFSLTPVFRKDANPHGAWYVEWSGVSCHLPGTEDARIRNAWTRFRLKRSAGKDRVGHYYEDKKHATDVIRDFKKWWQERNGKTSAPEKKSV